MNSLRNVMLSIATALVMFSASAVRADNIPGLFNTGSNNNGIGNTSGGVLVDGAVDPHYALTASADSSAPGPNSFVVNAGFPIAPSGPWTANTNVSKWIAPKADQSVGHPPGNYTYEMKFSINGLNPATATIVGQWATDNPGRMFLNGVDVADILTEPTFQVMHPFSITSGFVSGVNTLDFQLVNLLPPQPFSPITPTGLRVEISGTAFPSVNPVPEPTSLALAGIGTCGMLAYGWRRRRSIAVA